MHDTTQFPALVESAGGTFREIYADRGYLSQRNAEVARSAGATPFIRPKKTTRRIDDHLRHRTPFQDMVASEQQDPATWYARYHRRSRIESTFGAIKRRWGGHLKSINRTMCNVEAQLKLLVWNLTRVRTGEF